jgi:hypothetical protein
MAQISVSISSDTSIGSSFAADLFEPEAARCLLTIHIHTTIPSHGGGSQIYDKSFVQFHGTKADLQLLADRIVAAAYPEYSQPDPDAQIDAEREDSAYVPGQGDCEVLRG